jgi:hypothetical protein
LAYAKRNAVKTVKELFQPQYLQHRDAKSLGQNFPAFQPLLQPLNPYWDLSVKISWVANFLMPQWF